MIFFGIDFVDWYHRQFIDTHFINKYLDKIPPISIEDAYYILDIGASEKFASIMPNISPCLKASRSNYYITNLQRKFSPRECLRLQGIPDNLFKQVSPPCFSLPHIL